MKGIRTYQSTKPPEPLNLTDEEIDVLANILHQLGRISDWKRRIDVAASLVLEYTRFDAGTPDFRRAQEAVEAGISYGQSRMVPALAWALRAMLNHEMDHFEGFDEALALIADVRGLDPNNDDVFDGVEPWPQGSE